MHLHVVLFFFAVLAGTANAAQYKADLLTECNLCMDVVGDAESYLEANSTYQDLLKFIQDDICTLLPSGDQAKCDDIAETVVDDLEAEAVWGLKGFSSFALCSMLSICDVYCCELPFRPEQVHVAVTGDPTEMAVSWVTGSEVPNPTVEVGVLSGNTCNYSISTSATVTTYEHAGWHGYIYHAVVTGLTPSKKYCYHVGDPEWDWSFTDYTFTAAPKIAPDTEFTFAVYGDMGICDVSDMNVFSLTKLAQNGDIDLVLHAGDISYANGYQATWDGYFRKMELIMAYVPYMAAVGNHEIPYNFTSYRHRFRNPTLESTGESDNLYFSFDYGNVHFIAYSLEKDVGFAPDTKPGGAQYEWLEADLKAANANRDQVPWIVMYGHRAFYCSSDSVLPCTIESSMYRHRLEGLIHDYKVDLVMQGHLHNYERSLPVYKHVPELNYNNPRAPVYTVIGTGGNREGTGGFTSRKPEWSVTRLSSWGHTLVHSNATALDWTFYDVTGNVILDHFTLVKTR